MSSIRLRSTERRLSRAVRIAMLGMALAGAAGSSQFAYAAGVSLDAAASQTYNIPAGPLGRNLSTFAAQSGVALSFDPALTAGLNSPAVQGKLAPRQAITQLLGNSGLEVVARQDGSYSLKKVDAPLPKDSVVLPEVLVTAAALDGTTEGTGSYTSGAASTATRMNLSIRETPQSVSVITRQRMEDQGLTQLSDVVIQTPGLTLNSSGNAGSDSSVIYSRGFEVENYQIDGVGQLYSNYSAIFQTNDMVLYDRVEVVRGATGLMNGIGSPSATINLVRKRPTKVFQASAKVEAGSWNYRRAEADVAVPLNDSGTLRGRLIAAYQDNDSYIDRLKEKKKILSGIVEADIAPSTLATFGFTFQEQDATGHSRSGRSAYATDGTRVNWSRSDSAAASWAYSQRESQSLFASLEHRFDNEWMIKGTYSHATSKYDEVLGYAAAGNLNRATGSGLGLYSSRWAGKPTQDSLDVYVSGPFSLLGRKHDFVAGITSSYTKDNTVNYDGWWDHGTWSGAIDNIYTWNGQTPVSPDYPARSPLIMREHTNSAYSTARFKPTDALSVIVGARITSWSTDTINNGNNTDHRAETGKITPYAGLVYEINKNWSAYASYTDIFKPQSNRGLDDRPLDPLLGKSYEIGAKGEFFDKRLNVSGAIYQIQQDNFAVQITPQPVGGLPSGNTAYEAVSGTKTRGIEFEVAGELARNWQGSASFSRNITQDRDGKLLNTQIPQNTFKLFSTYRLANVGNGLTLGGGVRWQSDIYSDNQGPAQVRFTQEAYSVVDLMARYQISKNMAATVNLYNAFDKWYVTTTNGGSYYGAPRNIRIALDMRF